MPPAPFQVASKSPPFTDNHKVKFCKIYRNGDHDMGECYPHKDGDIARSERLGT